MITRIEIQKRELFAEGYEFPITGAYEKLTGKAHGEVKPQNLLNKGIVNLQKAPRNKKGMVEYITDVCILKPVDMRRGNRKIFCDAPNRGSKRILMFLNDAPASNNPITLKHAGNGFLMREGYTIIWSGWQGDLIPGENWLTMQVPIATNSGKEIVNTVRTEILVNREGIYSYPLSGDRRVMSYEAVAVDHSSASVTVRLKSYDSRVALSHAEWKFAACNVNNESGKLETKASNRDLCLVSGFKPGHIYECIYKAKNPLVLGLGFAGVRDLISFLRYAREDNIGNLNPLRSKNDTVGVLRAYAGGRSQSGRFLRDFVYQGFNEDELHRRVFDAISPHAAGGGRVFLNYEFARPVTSSQQHNNQTDPELFPFAYGVIRDPQSGKVDGILKRPKTDPYVIHTQTSTEYWQKRAALVQTDGRGKDITIPKKVRVYTLASTQHNAPFGSPPEKQYSQQLTNSLPAGDLLRALIFAMDRWVNEKVSPPPSQIPRVTDATLVQPDQKSTGFPEIPGVRYTGLHNRQLFLDYGREINQGKIDLHPPRDLNGRSYKVLVPRVDADGNEIAGVRMPGVRVPLGTYTGWNLQRVGLAEDELCGLLGSYIPFAVTKRERAKTGDPRLSLEERYGDQEEYVRQIATEVRAMVAARFLLPEDGVRIIEEAKQLRLFANHPDESRR